MLTHTRRRNSRLFRATLVLSLLASLLTPSTVGAHDESEGTVGEASTTPIAAPFVGSFEVWCTMGNPAPGTLCRTHHSSPAIDFGMDPGTPINATGHGVVEEIETTCVGTNFCRGGAGNFIAILHDDGRYSRYLHLDEVFVDEGQVVDVGDVIGTSGITGQTSAPHLHYDEQFPRGTRIPMGTLIACVDGEQVLYPESLGLSDWNDVPFGTVIRNDDYSCLGDTSLETTADIPVQEAPEVEPPAALPPTPIIASGEGVFGIAAPIVADVNDFEAEINADGEITIISVNASSFTVLDEPDSSTTVRLRIDSSSPWSPTVSYDPTTVLDGPTCEGLHATSGTQGTRGPDVIIGTDGDDLIEAEQGDDIVCGGDGNDTIFGGRGADIIFGESGDDDIRSGIGRDMVFGGSGDDALRSGNGIDVVLGQGGNDFILGGNGNDDLGGGAGADQIDGRNGDDVIKGGGGDDTLIGNRHNDELIGGAGFDTYDGGPGIDDCRAKAADAPDPVGCEL